jgi:hypothetical protein
LPNTNESATIAKFHFFSSKHPHSLADADERLPLTILHQWCFQKKEKKKKKVENLLA